MKQNKQRIIFHIDMNAFFASCEQVVHPELRNKAIIVGGDPSKRSGIVLAASYEAKKFGVKTASTIYQAKKLCPHGIVVSPTKGLYSEMSKKVMAIFDQYTPLKEQLSIDEAFLDMTGTDHLFGSPIEAAKRIQKHILEEVGLSSSVGIAHNKLLAKMASDMKKPMGITTLYEEEISEKMWPLAVGELYGVGKKTVPKIQEIGIRTIGDLANINIKVLSDRFGERSAISMKQSANGWSSDQLKAERKGAKSIGNELTYGRDLDNISDIHKELLVLADKVAFRLRKKDLKCRTISIKLKYNDFSVITRSKTLQGMTDATDLIYSTAKNLAQEKLIKKPIRLIGLTVSNFDGDIGTQLSLFDEVNSDSSVNKVDDMMDQIRDKYGYGAIKKAKLIEEN